MILNERILRLVLALSEELHFGRAAATLHVSQSALSGTLKNLERDLGVRIFKRTSRHVELTEAGLVLVIEARRLIDESERVVALVKRSSSDAHGPLRIGYAPSTNLSWLAALISSARKEEFTLERLQFVSAPPLDLQADLLKGTLNAAFFEGDPCHPAMRSLPLFQESLEAVVATSHPFSHLALMLSSQFRSERIVWLKRDNNPFLYNSVQSWFAALGHQALVAQEVSTFYECLQFVKEGLGISFLPQSMKPKGGERDVMFIRLPEDTPQVEYTLAHCRESGSQALERFIEFVRKHIPGLTIDQ